MRIIDLLNKIAKGEEVPKKIKWDEEEFTCNKNVIYRNEDDEPLIYNLLPSGENLNDEIEIIEEVEDKEYEDIEELGTNFTYGNCTDELTTIDWQISVISNAINALIRNQKKILEQLKKEGNNE